MAEEKVVPDVNKEDFMTPEEIVMVNDCLSKLINNQGELSQIYSEYADIEEHYQNEQEELPDVPNTKVGILNANIEGQAAMIMEQDMAIMARGESAGDDDYAEDVRVGLEWTLRKNYFKRTEKEFVRRFLKFGTGAFTVRYDPEALNGFGLVKIYSVPLTRIYIDDKVKEPSRLQEAEYYAEAIPISKTQIEELYGEDKAELVQYGNMTQSDNTDVFKIDGMSDDDTGTVIIMFWSRQKGKLRLREFSKCGILLFDSHKTGNRKTNQKDSEERISPYYKYVNNKYPIFIASLYQREGNFWGFGDGKLLLPLQKLINELYDKIRMCARPNLLLFDTNSEVDLSDFDENSLSPRPFDGTQNTSPVQVVPWGQINEAWWRLLSAIHVEVQRVTRFYDLMSGGGSGAGSATESSLQHQQGSQSTNDKKLIIQSTLGELLEYVLGIMIEKYTESRSFRVKEGEDDYKWIDFKKMSEVPVKIPNTQKFRTDFAKKHKNKEVPKWELLTGDDGKALTKSIDVDVEVTIGAGLPKNKVYISQFIEKMSMVQLMDKSGQPKPAMFWEEFRDFLRKYIGIPLKEDDAMAQQMQQLQQQMMMAQGQGQPLPQGSPSQGQPNMPTARQPQANPNAEGLSPSGRPSMSRLADIRKG